MTRNQPNIKSKRNFPMSENTDVSVDDLAPTVLVGTFREDNAEWIAEKKLYRFPT